MAKKTPEEILDGLWIDELKKNVSSVISRDGTKREMQTVLCDSFLDYYRGREIKDGGKVIETLMKIVPAKDDPKESDLGEPVTAVSYAESILANHGRPVGFKTAEEVFRKGDSKKIMARITEPFRMGDTVQYKKADTHEGMKEAMAEVVETEAGIREVDPDIEEYNPEAMMLGRGEESLPEEHLSYDEIKGNVEKSRRYGTDDIAELSGIMERRREERQPAPHGRRPTHDREMREKWAAAQSMMLENLRARKAEEEAEEATQETGEGEE